MSKNSTLDFVQDNSLAIGEKMRALIPHLDGVYDRVGNGKAGIIAQVSATVDNYNERYINDKATCTKGCAFCCHDNIAVTKLEMDRINWYIKKNKIVVNKELYDLQNKKSGKEFMKLPFADRRCMMLDSSNVCMIYEVRPLICRQYHSTSPPLQCLPDENGKIDTGILRSIEIYALMTAVVGMEANEHTVLELHNEI